MACDGFRGTTHTCAKTGTLEVGADYRVVYKHGDLPLPVGLDLQFAVLPRATPWESMKAWMSRLLPKASNS